MRSQMIELSGLFELRLLLRNSEEKEIVMVRGTFRTSCHV